MREPRYRFSDDVRATTRAVALRMVHARAVAASPEELEAWIAKTDDIRQRLTAGGYGARFTAADLFPLYEGFVTKASAVAPRQPDARGPRRTWIGLAIGAIIVIVLLAIVFIAR